MASLLNYKMVAIIHAVSSYIGRSHSTNQAIGNCRGISWDCKFSCTYIASYVLKYVALLCVHIPYGANV